MRKLLVAVGIALGAAAAHADNTSFYLGAGVSRDYVSDITYNGVDFARIHGTSWKVFAGMRPVHIFAIEAGYLDLISPTSTAPPPAAQPACPGCPVPRVLPTTGSNNAQAFTGYAVAFLPLPLPFLDVFGKAGVSRWKLSFNSALSPVGQPVAESGTEFAWGLGTQVHFGNFGGRLEYENFKIPSTNGARVVSLDAFLNLY